MIFPTSGFIGLAKLSFDPLFVVSLMKVNRCKVIKKDIIGESCAEEEGVVLGRYEVYES